MTTTYHSLKPLTQPRIHRSPDGLDAIDFLRGTPIVGAPPPPWVFEIELDSGAAPPHLLGGPVPFASQRLLAILAEAGIDTIQAFPAVLRVRGGGEFRDHAVLNVIGLVDATDLDASVGTVLVEGEDGPMRMEFERLVLSPAQTRGLPMFRLFHDPSMLLVDDRVMALLHAQRPKEGWGFAALEVEVSAAGG